MRLTKRSLAIVTTTVLAVSFLAAAAVMAADPATSAGPTLSINVPTINFAKPTETEEYIDIPWLADYLTGAYKYLLSIATLIAAVMMMIGGFQWLTAGGDASKVGKGKKRISGAILGLVLIFGTYLLLVTVNPDLVTFKPLRIKTVAKELFDFTEHDEGDIPPSGASSSQTTAASASVCRTIESCRAICQKPQSEWPTATTVSIDPSQAHPIISDPANGLAAKNQRGTDALNAALQRAGQIAKTMDPGYSISVGSSYRTVSEQISKVCGYLERCKTDPTECAKIGGAVAWPGGSYHGAGIAVDVLLYKNGSLLTTGSYDGQNNAKWADGARKLCQIMEQAGFVRFRKEIWHFELQGSSTKTCRCSCAACPFPPSPLNCN